MSADCLFCKILRGEIPGHRVAESEHTVCILDAFPATEGHLLLLTKAHFEFLHEVPEEILADLGRQAGRVARAFHAVGEGAYNVVQNNGRAASQVIPHVHFHLVPRRENDQLFHITPGKKHDAGYYTHMAERLGTALKSAASNPMPTAAR